MGWTFLALQKKKDKHVNMYCDEAFSIKERGIPCFVVLNVQVEVNFEFIN